MTKTGIDNETEKGIETIKRIRRGIGPFLPQLARSLSPPVGRQALRTLG